jgi:hypothetical protein
VYGKAERQGFHAVMLRKPSEITAKSQIGSMTDGSHQLKSLAGEIRVADAVVVVGAGFSFEAGMPLSGHLPPLVWHTLDSHPYIICRTCETLGVAPGYAKDVIGLDSEKLRVAFSSIAAAPDARRTFQYGFAGLDRERSKNCSVAHAALARLIHCGLVVQTISLNWDSLLETAFERRYGIDVNADARRLWKPHGDCKRPDDKWTLPHQPGTISDELVRKMTSIAAERPRILLIVGYSERDEVVVERLIAPLARGWRVFRIGPNATGEGAIRGPAADSIALLANCLVSEPEFPGWEFVSFAGQRGIEAAISGESLGPRDTEICPRLPYFGSMKTALDLLHTVEIAGGSGCGKSITAWQLAADLNGEGWEVLRPASACSSHEIVTETVVAPSTWKRVLVIDDTQKYPEGFGTGLAERTSDRLKVIRATTDFQGETANVFRLPAKPAVTTLADAMRRRRPEVLPIVRRYDPQVGDGYLDIPLERRIKDAEEAGTPWQFAYILRGGWSQAKRTLDNLRDSNRADRLLFCIAVRQVVSLDEGCAVEHATQSVAMIGGDPDSVPNELEFLRSQAAILSGTPIRCPHIQSALVAMQRFLADRRDPLFSPAVAYLRTTCVDNQSPLRGVSWLISELYSIDSLRGIEFLTEEDVSGLVQRCCRAVAGVERRDAAFLLSTLLRPHGFVLKALAHHHAILQGWLERVEAVNAYALGTLINNLYNADRPEMQRLVGSAVPERIAERLAGASTQEGYAWGYFLDRLSLAGKQWRTAMKVVLPADRIGALAPLFSRSEIGQLDGYLHGVSAIDRNLATRCLKTAIPALQRGFHVDPAEAYADIRKIRWRLLGQHPFGDSVPTKAQRRLSKTITDAIVPERMLGCIYTCRFGDWERYADLLFWLRHVNPAKHEAVVASVDWGRLDASTADLWAKPPRELRLLLAGLVLSSDGNPVGPWIAVHADKISEVDPIIASISPEAAITVVRNGGILNLAGHNGSDWKRQAIALWRIGNIERDVALSALESDKARIADNLSKLGTMDCEELPPFLEFLEEFAPHFLPTLFQTVDSREALSSWPRALTNHRKQVRNGARQVFKFAQRNASGELKAIAEKLAASKPRRKRDLFR